MKRIWPLCWAGILLLAGCGKPVAAPPPPVDAGAHASAMASADDITEAQPKLQTIKLWLGPEQVEAEVAVTLQQIRTGMMFRTNMAENESMLFVMRPHRAGFWMKNCTVPLSVAYINPDGVIREIHDLQPQNTNPVVAASDDIQFALETPQGWYQRHNIREGMTIRTERGSLLDTFRLRP
ncbi:MAG: DUF192 domain-containing protein [Verrucomicrobiota bacterium]